MVAVVDFQSPGFSLEDVHLLLAGAGVCRALHAGFLIIIRSDLNRRDLVI